MSWLHAIVIALLQGAFELFPVSSLGHSVLVPSLLGWDEWKAGDPNNASFVAFVVILHLGTAIALLSFYWRDWVRVVAAMGRSVARRQLSDDPDEKLGWMVVIGSIPAGLLGVLFQHKLEELFGKPVLVAIFLFLNGFLMLGGERLRRRSAARDAVVLPGDGGAVVQERGKSISEIGAGEAAAVGTMQALALFPGFSRSGSTIVGGLLVGLRHTEAARFSFMLATPIILAANLLKAPEIFASNANIGPAKALVGFLISGITAYLAVRFLTKYFETERLDPFGWYCIAFGLFCLVVFGVRGFSFS